MKQRFVVLAIALAAGAAGAQQLYRCGSTFSQQPCGPDATVVPSAGVAQPNPLPPDVPAGPGVEQAAKAACVDRLRRDVTFRDPDSVKVGLVDRKGVFRHGLLGKPVRVYRLAVNAKNGYGGYTGEQAYMCFTDLANERDVLLVQRLDDVR